jgi:hypothetical protein
LLLQTGFSILARDVEPGLATHQELEYHPLMGTLNPNKSPPSSAGMRDNGVFPLAVFR